MSKNESKPQAVDHVKNVPLINARMLVKRIIWKMFVYYTKNGFIQRSREIKILIKISNSNLKHTLEL